MNKKLSIVVPVYNVEEYLVKCLDSLIFQTRSDYKIIVVNDGTKDNSQKIIDEYVNKYPDKIEAYIKENGGLSDARNYGLQYVDTPYVMFIDSDDFVEKALVETTLNKVEEEDLDILVFNYYQYRFSQNKVEVLPLKIKDGTYSLKSDKSLLVNTPNAAWNKVYKTSLFKDNNILFPKGYFYEDLGTTPRLLYYANKVGYIDVPLYHYLVDRPNNISTQVNKRILHIVDISSIIVNFYKEHNSFDEYEQELQYLVNINFLDNLRKVMNSSDKVFAFRFIDSVFDYMKLTFKNKLTEYKINTSLVDFVYRNRLLCKMYYIYKNRGRK